MAKISRQSWLIGFSIPLIGLLLYPSLALNYPALPFNGLTDLYDQYKRGHYYSPVMTQNMQAFRGILEKYHSQHQQYPQNVKSLYEDAQATQQRKALQSTYSPHDYSQENYYGIDQDAVFASNQNGTLLMAKGAYLMF